MKKAEKEILVAFLGKTLNMPSEKVDSLFTQADPKSEEYDFAAEASKILVDADIERVKEFKTKNTEEFQKGYKKAKSEVLTAFEKEIADKHGLKSDKVGLELIDDLVASKIKTSDLEP